MSTVLTRDRGLPAYAISADILPPGALAGPWRIEHELGRGGMGAVYAVVHDGIGKRAALKVIHRRLLSSEGGIERMLLEARVVNQVRHPNIVDIFETGTLPDGRPYIVMERLDGAPLSELVQHAKLATDGVIAILLQICGALAAAHAAGIVHRDLKLDNIVVGPDGVVKVLDWGIAKVVTTDLKQTLEGELVGTPQYLSPEQARGGAVTPQTDVYSLGVVAYELFLEQLPFEAETAAEILVMHLRHTPPPPRDAWPDIPPPLEELLIAMLAKDPTARPTMDGVAEGLEATRAELQRRRGLIAASSMPAVSIRITRPRLHTAAALALTAADASGSIVRVRRRARWPIAVAFAGLATAIAMIATHGGGDDGTAAAAGIDAATAAPSTATPTATPSTPTATGMSTETAASPSTAASAASAASMPTSAGSAAAAAGSGAKAKPLRKLLRKHHPAHVDPNGTVDPYR